MIQVGFTGNLCLPLSSAMTSEDRNTVLDTVMVVPRMELVHCKHQDCQDHHQGTVRFTKNLNKFFLSPSTAVKIDCEVWGIAGRYLVRISAGREGGISAGREGGISAGRRGGILAGREGGISAGREGGISGGGSEENVMARSQVFSVEWSKEYSVSINRPSLQPCSNGNLFLRHFVLH